jgi:hypothetical protein
MRARVLSAALCVCAANLGAQATMVPGTSVVAQPAAPSEPTKAEFRVGGFMMAGERNYSFLSGGIKTATGSVRGLEVLLRAPGIGVSVRSLSGTFGSQPKVISADARLLLFPPVFTVFGGVGKRALSSTISTKVYDVMVGGVSSTVSIGGSGLRTHISGAYIFAPAKNNTGGTAGAASAVKNASTGIEGEADLYYRFPGVPLFVTVGYRTEVFNAKSGTIAAPEEVRGLRFGGGIQFGGH